MRHFAWSSEHEVFIAQLDAEHRGLFEVAEAFERAIDEKAPAEERRERIRALTAHVEDHLSHEEWLMQSVRYPLFAWHRQQHDTVRRRLRLFLPLIEDGNQEAIETFVEFLEGWLTDHTGVTDRMMAAFVRNYERAHASSALERWGGPTGPSIHGRDAGTPKEVAGAIHVGLNRH